MRVPKYRFVRPSPQDAFDGALTVLLPEWSSRPCPVIGMLHAPPLPGSSDYNGDFAAVRQLVIRDAETLLAGGVDGLMIENFGDAPFYPGRVPSITVAAMSSLASEVRRMFDVPLGINVLRNDGQAALAVAIASGASFIRVNVLCGVRVADQGMLHGIAHDLLRDRAYFQARPIRIWADVDVKHSAALATRSLTDEVHDLIGRGKADAVIVSGSATGEPIDMNTLQEIKVAAATAPVIVGSGATAESTCLLVPLVQGMIVGSTLKQDGRIGNPVDIERVKRFVAAVNSKRG